MSDADRISRENHRMGARFAQLLYEYLGQEKWKAMRLGNAAIHLREGHGKLCDSHEYCDANQFILDAFEEVIGREAEPNDDDDMTRMQDAWAIATKRYLCAECEPTGDDPILPDSPCCPGAFRKGGADCVYCRNCKELC